MKMPTCSKCGRRHFNVWSCERAAEVEKRGTGAPIQWAKREGWVEFGDKLETVKAVKNTRWLKERPKNRWRDEDDLR